ncbi:hypothetical protein [Pseudomonas mediterranea]
MNEERSEHRLWMLPVNYYRIAKLFIFRRSASMKKILLSLYILFFGCSASACGLEISQSSDAVYIKSGLPNGGYLRRALKLGTDSPSRNQVVNFAGGEFVSSPSLGGYVSRISPESDDAAPVKFGGYYIGANHGAYYGVQISAPKVKILDVGSKWIDQEGTPFTMIEAVAGKSATFLSDSRGDAGSWNYKGKVVGDLTPVAGGLAIETSSQFRVQIYPAVRRVSLSIDTIIPMAGKTKIVDAVSIKEVYEILRPGSEERVAQVEITYSFTRYETDVYTKVTSFSELQDFSMSGVQAGPLNGSPDSLMQKVSGGATLSGWTSMKLWSGTQRIPTTGALQMSQKSTDGKQRFGLTIGVSKALINGKPVGPAPVVMISSAKKQYPIAIEPGAGGFSGTLYPGDVAEVYAYRQYWLGDEPPPAK